MSDGFLFLIIGICIGLLLGHVVNACALRAAFRELKEEQKERKRKNRDPADWWKDGDDDPFGIDYVDSD